MRGMKTHLTTALTAVLVCLLFSTTQVHARGADSPEGAMFRTHNLGALAFGLEGGQETRRLYYDGGGPADIRTTLGHLYLSLDVCSWLTISGGAGVADAAQMRPGISHGASPMWTAGLQASIWQHDIFDPTFFESRGTLQVVGTYLNYEFTEQFATHEWEEYRVALLASAERFAEKDFGADSHASPYSLRMFIGPYYSEVDPEGFARDQEIGVTAGLDIKLARGFSLGYEARYRDFYSQMFNVIVHF